MTMRRLIYNIILAATLVGIVASCTHHNGDIGVYFGTWKLESITVDGVESEEYRGDMFWKFQSEVICMETVDDALHTRTDHWGKWSEADGVLTLNYTFSDDNSPAGTSKYAPPAVTGLPAAVSHLDIVSKSGSRIVLRYVTGDGKAYQYILGKW